MVSGHLCVKSGKWYAVLGVYGSDGKRKNKWVNTGFAGKGNKKKAEAVLQELRAYHSYLRKIDQNAGDMLFSDYMINWLESMKPKVAPNTHYQYSLVVRNQIYPYFCNKGIQLRQLSEIHLNDYYDSLYCQGVSSNTVQKHHANIRKALQSAYEKQLILYNAADRADKPRKQSFHISVYSSGEAQRLLKAVSESQWELILHMALFFGLRRSELLGIKWKAVNFEAGTLTISHTIVRTCVDGKFQIIGKDKVKRSKSYRSFPLPPYMKLLLIKYMNQRYPDNIPNAEDYVFADNTNQMMDPDYLSRAFRKLLADNGLRPIRFHDIRHSCAGMLINARVSLPEVQQWMGHSCIFTTIDQYGHLEFASKLSSAKIISQELKYPELGGY